MDTIQYLKQMLPLKIILTTHFQWLLRFRNDWHLTPPSSRNKVRSHVNIQCIRVAAQRVCNTPAFLLDGCYAFISLIILFLGLFYQGTLTEHLLRNLFTNSGVKLVKMDRLTEPLA